MTKYVRNVRACRRKRKAERNAVAAQFASSFEERKALQYLFNVVDSSIMEHKTQEVFIFAAKIIGKKRAAELVKQYYPEDAAKEDFSYWLFNEHPSGGIDAEKCEFLLYKIILPRLEPRLEELEKLRQTDSEKRLDELVKVFSLNAAERAIVEFFFVRRTSSTIREAFGNDSQSIGQYEELLRLKSDGDVILGVKRPAFTQSLENAILLKTQILIKETSTDLSLSTWCMDYLLGLGSKDLGQEFFTLKNDEYLEVREFDITKEELDVLNVLLRRKGGTNILFYGTAGMGKSSFARCLAKRYGKQLLTVKAPETDEMRDRMRAVYATVNTADRERSIVLVDEADELLNSGQGFMYGTRSLSDLGI